jgi:hypothetical protein
MMILNMLVQTIIIMRCELEQMMSLLITFGDLIMTDMELVGQKCGTLFLVVFYHLVPEM